MRVFRTSGLPVEFEDIQKFKQDLADENEELKKEFGDFTKLDNSKKAEYQKRFETMRDEILSLYKREVEWDLDQFNSISKLKKLVNKYGVVAFGKDQDTKKPAIFIIDSKF